MGEAEPHETEVIRPRPAALPTGLAAVVSRMPGPLFAVVDGGHFDDVRTDLASAGLTARSLFLGEGERDVELYGPWLVTLRTPTDVGTVLALVGDRPAVVFWSCPQGDVSLYGHLRRLNEIRIPTWAAAGQIAPEPGVAADLSYETVLFRHWDPRVLGTLMPVLDDAQFARILGLAAEICFVLPDQGGLKRVIADAAWPIAPAGMMVLRTGQIEAFTGRLAIARRRRLRLYLRAAIGPRLDSMSDSEVDAYVLRAEQTAKEVNIVTEAGQCRWAYLVWATGGLVVGDPVVAGIVKQPDRNPDKQIAGLMKVAAESFRTRQPAERC